MYRIPNNASNIIHNDLIQSNKLGMSPKFIKFKGVDDYFVLCKMLRIICERKHEHFTQKIVKEFIANDHGTKSRVNNELVYALILRGMKLWDTTRNNTKQSADLTWFKKYLRRFILSSSNKPD